MSVSLLASLLVVLNVALSFVSAASAAGNSTSSGNRCAISPSVPVPIGSAKALSPSSSSDDTARIQQAIDQLKAGDWLVFQGGTYRISKHLVVGVSGVTLYSSGATIHATSATDGALMIQG